MLVFTYSYMYARKLSERELEEKEKRRIGRRKKKSLDAGVTTTSKSNIIAEFVFAI